MEDSRSYIATWQRSTRCNYCAKLKNISLTLCASCDPKLTMKCSLRSHDIKVIKYYFLKPAIVPIIIIALVTIQNEFARGIK